MRDWLDEWWPVVLAVAAFGLIVWAVYVDHEDWQAYAKEHHCIRTGKERTDFMMIGDTPYFTTEREWLCDRGERVWR